MGYNNIRIKEGDQEKAAFTTPLEQYEPMVMSFGLWNAPETFMRTMNCLFQNIQNKYSRKIHIYMDDILVATPNDVKRHREIVKKVLEIMGKEFFFLKISKCKFKQPRVEYLRLIIDRDTIKTDLSKVASLKELL